MTEAVLIALITGTAAVSAAVITGVFVLIKQGREINDIKKQGKETHELVNSGMARLLEYAEQLHEAIGKAKGIEQERNRKESAREADRIKDDQKNLEA